MNPSSDSGNQDNDRKQKRKASAEPETKPKKIKITYDPLKVNPMEAKLSGNCSRRVFHPPGESPPSSPSSSSSLFHFDSTSSSSNPSSPLTPSSEISSPLSHPFPTRTPNPYSVVRPDYRFTVIPPTPTTQSSLERLHSDVNGWLEILGAAYLNHLDMYAMSNLWDTFIQDFLVKATDARRRILSEAPGPRGRQLEVGESSHHCLIRNRCVLQEKIPADELEEENLCRDIVVWKSQSPVLWFPVLSGEFQWLFNWFRMNPSERAPHMVFPVVVYRAGAAGPTPPTNLAAILQALEAGTSEMPEPEYVEVSSESDSDEEMEDAQADDLPQDHPAEIVAPSGEYLGASSSGGNSTRLETLEALHLNQAMLASRLDAQETANAEFRSFMARQTASTEGIHDALARILRRLGT